MIKLENVSKSYNNHNVLNSVNLNLNEGLVYILGRSGVGKTTLLNLLGAIDTIYDGEIYIYGKQLKSFTNNELTLYKRHIVGFIFQSNNLIPDLNVYENLAFILKVQGIDENLIKKRIDHALEAVGLKGYEDKPIDTLSGGEAQRVAIARCIVKKPKIILADEITGNLDSKNVKLIMNIMKNLSKKILVIMVTHNKDIVQSFPGECYYLVDGKLKQLNNQFNNKYIPTIDHYQATSTIDNYKITTNTRYLLFSGIKSIINNRLRMIVMLVLLISTLSLFGFISTINHFNLGNAYQGFSDKYKMNTLTVNQATSYSIGRGDTIYSHILFKNKPQILIDRNVSFAFPINYQISNNKAIQNVIFLDDLFELPLVKGRMPNNFNEVLITDYLAKTLNILLCNEHVCPNQTLTINGISLSVVGIVETNYSNHKNLKTINERVAYKEQLEVLSAIYLFEEDYINIHNNYNNYPDEGYLLNDLMETSKENLQLIKASSIPSLRLVDNEILVSKELYEKYNLSLNETYKLLLTKYHIKQVQVKIVGIYEGKGIVLSDNLFETMNKERFGYLALTPIDYLDDLVNINQFVITNPSLAKPLQIHQFQLLVNDLMVFILVIITAITLSIGYLLAYLMLNKEKRTIGIKKTLGLSTKEISILHSSKYIVIGLLSFLTSLILTSLINFIFDANFNFHVDYVYLKLDTTIVIYIFLINLCLLLIMTIPNLLKFTLSPPIKLIQEQ